MANPGVRNLRLLELIHRDVWEPQRFPYRDELRRRLENQDYRKRLEEFDEPEVITFSTEQRQEINDDEPPAAHSEKNLAEKILASNCDFSSMEKPDRVLGFVKNVRDSDMAENEMSPKQLRFWRSIKAHYRKHKAASNKRRSA